MKTSLLGLATSALLLVAGCKSAQRSISNSSYQGDSSSHYHGSRASDPGFAYRGELNEFDVLSVKRDAAFSNDEISAALDGAHKLKLKAGSSILLIQSGAVFPDGPMTTELSKHFRVTPFTGVPRETPGRRETNSLPPYAESLRMAAARGGCETILCYWGMLESGEANAIGKPVSWVPVVRWMVPDKKQHMRIRLKLALIDVRSGGWSIFSPEPFEDQTWTTSLTRGNADQRQVESLKKKAYEAGVRGLAKLHLDPAQSAAIK